MKECSTTLQAPKLLSHGCLQCHHQTPWDHALPLPHLPSSLPPTWLFRADTEHAITLGKGGGAEQEAFLSEEVREEEWILWGFFKIAPKQQLAGHREGVLQAAWS